MRTFMYTSTMIFQSEITMFMNEILILSCKNGTIQTTRLIFKSYTTTRVWADVYSDDGHTNTANVLDNLMLEIAQIHY